MRALVLLLFLTFSGSSLAFAETRSVTAIRFVKLLEAGNYEKATREFNKTLQRLFTAKKLKAFWTGVQAKAGPFVRQRGVVVKKLRYAGKLFPMAHVVVQFKRETFELRLVFSRNKIAGLRLLPHKIKVTKVRGKVVVRRFVNRLVARNYEAAVQDFDKQMKRVFAVKKLRAFWERLQAQMGSFQSQGRIRQHKLKLQAKVFFPTLVAVRFQKAKLDFRIVLNSKDQIAGLRLQAFQGKPAKAKTPAYVSRAKFSEVARKVGTAKYPLQARLTLPKGTGMVPGVVLVHGSGAHDMDETIGPNKPFRDLAWGLSSRGIAVLRYTKRNKAWARRLYRQRNRLTLKEEVLEDAVLAAKQLLRHPRVNKVFVVGHSLGGYAAPLIAKMAPKTVAGIVILAGNARPLETLIVEQYNYILTLDGKLTKSEKILLEGMKKKVRRLRAGNLKGARAKELPLNIPPAYWAFLRRYNQTKTAAALAQPILVMQGGRDYQVTKKDFQRWKQALSSKRNATFRLYPSLNHLFVAGKGRSTPSEYRKPGNVSQEVLRDLAQWIWKQQKAPRLKRP